MTKLTKTKWQLTSTCDDSGAMLAGRLDSANFSRVVGEFETEEEAYQAKENLLRWYEKNSVPIGWGCLGVRVASNDCRTNQ